MLHIEPGSVPTSTLHGYMLSAVAPRPICFASTLSENGHPNLAPYSFFNAFSSNPPILIFSSNRKTKDNTTKHTYANIKSSREVVINIVSYEYVRKMALASIEYPPEVNEFEKSGFTQLASEKVKPFRVKESPVQFECKVNEIIELGNEGGAGNLFLCEILLMHIDESILGTNGRIDPDKINLCGRMGGKNYVKAAGDALFDINQPVDKIGIGFDQLPDKIKLSNILTGNELAMLASVEKLPSVKDISEFANDEQLLDFKKRFVNDQDSIDDHLQEYAKQLLSVDNIKSAWKVLLQE